MVRLNRCRRLDVRFEPVDEGVDDFSIVVRLSKKLSGFFF